MAFQMSFDKDSLLQKVIPAGLYDVRLLSFKPELNKNKDGINFKPRMVVINNPEYDKTSVFDTLSSKAGFTQWDFVHAFGLELEEIGNGNYVIPGTWDGDPATFKETDPSTWKYDGPLIGRDAKLELAIEPSFNDSAKMVNKIRRYICAVPDCATKFPDNKHIMDMLRKK